jgi:hypothetical protein
MFKRTQVISVAAIAALLLSGTATAMAASNQVKTKAVHTSKLVSKQSSKRPAAGPARLDYSHEGPSY